MHDIPPCVTRQQLTDVYILYEDSPQKRLVSNLRLAVAKQSDKAYAMSRIALIDLSREDYCPTHNPILTAI